MKHSRCVWFAATLLFAPTIAGAQNQQWVVAAVSGQERVALIPQRELYTTGGPSVSVPVPIGEVIRLASGEAVEGFEFVGWHEGDAIRIVVRALIPRDRAPASTVQPEQDRFDRRQVATLALRLGETVTVERMRELGATPLELTIVER